ncbi:hypothetical protein ACFLQN_03080 [Candidatus Aenigmatarchaeota archaeon]
MNIESNTTGNDRSFRLSGSYRFDDPRLQRIAEQHGALDYKRLGDGECVITSIKIEKKGLFFDVYEIIH